MFCSKTTCFILAGAALTLSACSEAPHKAPAVAAPPVAVDTIASALAEWPTGSDAVGTVRSRVSAVLSSKAMGYVREVRVRAGDSVKPGQILAELDSQDLDVAWRQAQAARDATRDSQAEAENAVVAAKANLELAQTTFRRIQDLFEKRSVSNQELDESSARVRTAQAAYEMALARKTQVTSHIRQSEEGVRAAEVMRSYAEIRAPFAGIVTERRVEPGILATPGLPLLTVEQAGGYRLEVSADESLGPRVRLGQAVRVKIESLDCDLEARVSEIVPAVDPGSRGFIVKIDLPAMKELRSGLFGRARFVTGSRKAVVVPAELVRKNGQIESVIVAENGMAGLRLITTGEAQGAQVEVLTGLEPGEKIVRNGAVADGARVEVR